MENVKKFLIAIVLLAVIIVLWVGTTFFFQGKEKTVTDGADAYTTQIGKSFEKEELDKVYDRAEESFPVSTEEFLDLVKQND